MEKKATGVPDRGIGPAMVAPRGLVRGTDVPSVLDGTLDLDAPSTKSTFNAERWSEAEAVFSCNDEYEIPGHMG